VDHFLESPYNGADIHDNVYELMDELAETLTAKQGTHLARLMVNIEQWRHCEIFAFPVIQNEEEEEEEEEEEGKTDDDG
jgi:branched-subunit amino acid aminotransferase/4-amino-4-deoxychorismate lyase